MLSNADIHDDYFSVEIHYEGFFLYNFGRNIIDRCLYKPFRLNCELSVCADLFFRLMWIQL
jgi:hypothetical protein